MAYLGIDIGGTNTKAVLLDDAYATVRSGEAPTCPDGSIDSILAAIRSAIAGFDLEEIRGACLALPGIVDNAEGEAVFVPNLGWFERIGIAGTVRDMLGIRPKLVNDAVCAAVGEAHFGSGRGIGSFLMLTLGTAVGAGAPRAQEQARRHRHRPRLYRGFLRRSGCTLLPPALFG